MMKKLSKLRLSLCYLNMLTVNSLLLERLEKWLQLMLKWSPQERGKDPKATPTSCFSQLEILLKLKVNIVLPLFITLCLV